MILSGQHLHSWKDLLSLAPLHCQLEHPAQYFQLPIDARYGQVRLPEFCYEPGDLVSFNEIKRTTRQRFKVHQAS